MNSYCLADNIVSLEPYQPKRGERQAGQARLITVQQSRDFLRISDSCHSLNRDCSKRLQKRERNRGVHDGNSALFISQRNTWAIWKANSGMHIANQDRVYLAKNKTKPCVPRDICIKGTIKLAKSSNHTHTTFTLSSFVVFLCLILSNDLRTRDTVTQNAE